MNKEYEKMDFVLGSTIEQAVNKLLEYKKKEKLVYCTFNGVTLYSDTVTMDSAYRAITGKSRVEFIEYLQSLNPQTKIIWK